MPPSDPFLLPSQDFEPAYLSLYRTGALAERVRTALAGLECCQGCPRNCRVNRLLDRTGTCQTGRLAVVSSAFPHHGEEDCLRGWRGSGTIFFSQCNLRCAFCQNFDISQTTSGKKVMAQELADLMLGLQRNGCHNINLVTPDHVVPQILEALLIAVEAGFRLPLVYNTSAYTGINTLALLDGVIDIYMPDYKTASPEHAKRYLQAKDYPQAAQAALIEMRRQVGALKVDEHGVAKRGVLVRHLVMPGDIAASPEVMRFLAGQVSPDTYINIMGQYRPAGKVSSQDFPEINRRVTADEVRSAYHSARQAGLWRFDQSFQ